MPLSLDRARVWPVRVAAGHPRTVIAAVAGLVGYGCLPHRWGPAARSVVAWDIAVLVMLALAGMMFYGADDDDAIARHAARQQEGEWTIFAITLLGIVFSFAALTSLMGNAKAMTGGRREFVIGVVAATLLLSWLATHVVFAMRYAHEYYERGPGATRPDGGLAFPGTTPPDYWDFLYFALVLGMTFQVSDVAISSRKLRRLATLHGLIGFLFNTVIVALTVNIAASLL